MRDEVADLTAELRRHLAWQEADGSKLIWKDPNAIQPAVEAQDEKAAALNVAPVASARRVAAAVPAAKAAVGLKPVPLAPVAPGERRTLDEIRTELGDCKRCKLSGGRTQIVFGSGNPRAELMFIGEAPGADEDQQGVPFVGKAGQLLTKMIEAMKLTRDDVYICNVVKCRPADNKNPEPDEIAACEPFLKAQIASVRPKVIVTLGKFAAQALLKDQTAITRMRGQWRAYEGIPLMPTFHPAYLLRVPTEKKLAWTDLQEVMKKLGRAP